MSLDTVNLALILCHKSKIQPLTGKLKSAVG